METKSIAVKPRQAYTFAVLIALPQTRINYQFSSAKKNISFGVFQKQGQDAGDLRGINAASASPSPLSTPTFNRAFKSTSPHHSSAIDTNDNHRESVSSSTIALEDSFSSNTNKSPHQRKYKSFGPDMIPLLPTTHYPSSKRLITGTLLITTPCTLYLIFDNTFSRYFPSFHTYTKHNLKNRLLFIHTRKHNPTLFFPSHSQKGKIETSRVHAKKPYAHTHNPFLYQIIAWKSRLQCSPLHLEGDGRIIVYSRKGEMEFKPRTEEEYKYWCDAFQVCFLMPKTDRVDALLAYVEKLNDDKLMALVQGVLEEYEEERKRMGGSNDLELGESISFERKGSKCPSSMHEYYDAVDVLEASNSEEDGSDAFYSDDAISVNSDQENQDTLVVPLVRRKILPAPTLSMENISLFSILRNNIGKDLSTIAMPIALNEPLNLLQKMCEELEYSFLLDTAAMTVDPVERMVLICAFAVSGYASTVHRAGRKPFNPMLGETYECVREDKKFKYVAEKVSHTPPIMACHAQGNGYTFFQDALVKSKFWGYNCPVMFILQSRKSIELTTTGSINAHLSNYNETYTWNKVTTCMRNVFSPTRYVEYYGLLTITCTNGYSAQLTFTEAGFFGTSKNDISGTVYSDKTPRIGKWDQVLYKHAVNSKEDMHCVWRATRHSENALGYGFTPFAIELNDDLVGVIPDTDTRYRPDQRLYEQGDVQGAENEKCRVEELQREKRKKMESLGVIWTPKWFTEEKQGQRHWVFNDLYWKTREEGFQKEEPLW